MVVYLAGRDSCSCRCDARKARVFAPNRLPAVQEGLPLSVADDIAAKDVFRICARGAGYLAKVHPGLFGGPSTFLVIAIRAGGNDVLPGVIAAQVPGDHVIQGQPAAALSAVLAGVIVAPKDLALVEFNNRAGTLHHVFQTDDRWAWESIVDCGDLTASVQNHRGFSSEHQADGSTSTAHIDRRKVSVKY